ncbi:MAG TPA: DUF6498-containing protein [Planctomycetota bacterium]|nr:DUF6498-containing protein [Planctomycetota bacterium]
MNWLGRLTQLLALSTLPLIGVFWADWSEATAIAYYWCETAIVVSFVALRLVIHRRRTKRRGHYVEKQTSTNGRPPKRGIGTYNATFLTTATAFGFGNLVFLVVLLGLFGSRVGGGELDLEDLREGFVIATCFVAIGFLVDLPGIGERPFAWVRLMAEGALSRVFVIYMAIFIGVFGAVMLDRPHTMFAVFFALRLFTDVASNFKQYDPGHPPRFMRLFVKDWPAFDKEWQTERQTRLAAEASDEEPFLGKPGRTPIVASRRT